MKKETYLLWEKEIPGEIDGENKPTITYYAAENKRGEGTVIVFPGGGYSHLAPHEGEGYALFLNSVGLDAFVVEYRLKPIHFPCQLLDARRAVRFVRANAEKFGIDPTKIAVMGSSAGGHLAALVSTYRPSLAGEGMDALDAVDPFPNATVLCYSVITADPAYSHGGSFRNLLGEENMDLAPSVSPCDLVDEHTPQAFIWHTASDDSVNVVNSYLYATALRKFKIPCEMHIFPDGPHGLGLARDEDMELPHLKKRNWTGDHNYVSRWAGLLSEWLTFIGYKRA